MQQLKDLPPEELELMVGNGLTVGFMFKIVLDDNGALGWSDHVTRFALPSDGDRPIPPQDEVALYTGVGMIHSAVVPLSSLEDIKKWKP